MTAAKKDLLNYLKMIAMAHAGHQFPKGWHYRGPADLLLREGQWFKAPKRATFWKRSEPHACFRNSAMYAVEHGLRYVEGYATSIIPVHHGWCVDDKGNVIEVTWKEAGKAYFGVEFPPLAVARGAVLFNPDNRTGIYRRALRKENNAKKNRATSGSGSRFPAGHDATHSKRETEAPSPHTPGSAGRR